MFNFFFFWKIRTSGSLDTRLNLPKFKKSYYNELPITYKIIQDIGNNDLLNIYDTALSHHHIKVPKKPVLVITQKPQKFVHLYQTQTWNMKKISTCTCLSVFRSNFRSVETALKTILKVSSIRSWDLPPARRLNPPGAVGHAYWAEKTKAKLGIAVGTAPAARPTLI